MNKPIQFDIRVPSDDAQFGGVIVENDSVVVYNYANENATAGRFNLKSPADAEDYRLGKLITTASPTSGPTTLVTITLVPKSAISAMSREDLLAMMAYSLINIEAEGTTNEYNTGSKPKIAGLILIPNSSITPVQQAEFNEVIENAAAMAGA